MELVFVDLGERLGRLLVVELEESRWEECVRFVGPYSDWRVKVVLELVWKQ